MNRTFKKHQTRGRFMVTRSDDGERWWCIDNLDSTLIEVATRREAEDVAQFARQYTAKHGDIDFGAFPYDLETALVYDSNTERSFVA